MASRSRGLERPGFDKIAGSRQVLASGLDGDQGWPRESSCGAGGWCGGRLRRTISTSDTCVQTPGTASPAASTGITGSGWPREVSCESENEIADSTRADCRHRQGKRDRRVAAGAAPQLLAIRARWTGGNRLQAHV
ncbi:hypothetical protein PVAP13_5KG186907 [Panicum virgatum]|uniref:Uncharacterized protein n=1 Tax=Panicum virgatum TaxID=38727 RepID=A0A8T0SIQ4_PANVG|nr:hypothetical protein PVAP13_5KG186907 [Panicum virgatum]